MQTILIASDHAGFNLKEDLKKYLSRLKAKPKDLGTCSLDSCDYPVFAQALAEKISSGKFKKGILICKSGIGNSIVANRFPGVRAALCYNVAAARLSRMHNDSNVLVLGEAFVPKELAKKILKVWLQTPFEGGRHLRRLNRIKEIERKIRSRK